MSDQTDAAKQARTAKGHVAHLERLIEQWTFRRDEGDGVPNKETLTAWIAHAEGELKSWKATLERAERESKIAPPLA